jgi:hypothetical protein
MFFGSDVSVDRDGDCPKRAEPGAKERSRRNLGKFMLATLSLMVEV